MLGFNKKSKTLPKILQIIVGSVGIIRNSPHLNPELFGHSKYFIAFKCPNSNTYDLIQKIQNVLEKSAPFLPGVLAQTRNDEH